jgi:hypothetical protein
LTIKKTAIKCSVSKKDRQYNDQKKRTDNTMTKRKETDNTMTKRRTDNTMAKRRGQTIQ